MKFNFDKKTGLILVPITIKGPLKIVEAIFAVDTGASTSVVNFDVLEHAGYKKSDAIDKTTITTGSKLEHVHIFKVGNMKALNLTRHNFEIISHNLPITTFIDGLLGLNFFRQKDLFISFKNGEIELE